jgi:hypothetical protein
MFKIFIIIALYNLNYFVCNSQSPHKIISSEEVSTIFNNKAKNIHQIHFPITQVVEFQDKIGKHYLVFTEKSYQKEGTVLMNDSIKAFCFLMENKDLKLEWNLSDFIQRKGNEVSEENNIQFLGKYLTLNDEDNDGLIEPIIIYGTEGNNKYEDGRIKILIYHLGKKKAIRHQNGTLDFERNTQVDAAFYELPIKIQEKVMFLMQKLMDENYAIFPYGWEESMKKKKVKFDEK